MTVYVQPPKAANERRGMLWQLEVPLYGLNDASLQFYFKCREQLLELGCQQSTVDPGLFFICDRNNILIEISGTHVDDFLHAGNEEFNRKVVQKLLQIFQMGKTVSKSFTFVGFDLTQQEDGTVKVYQSNFSAN